MTALLTFGAELPGVAYVARVGGYVVLVDHRQDVATIETESGWFLPGGGVIGDETPRAAAIREAKEECGLAVRISRELGEAHEFVYSEVEGIHFRKAGTFYAA